MHACRAQSHKPVPRLLRRGHGDAYWRHCLKKVAARGFNRLHLTDFDGTKYGDILVAANEAHGPVDRDSGEKRWKLYDRAFKKPEGAVIDGVVTHMSNGEHLAAEYRDLFAKLSLNQLQTWVCENVSLIPGASSFVHKLEGLGIATLGITNGAWQLADALLRHNNLKIPFIGNWFEGTELRFVHGEHVGVDKARLVLIALEMGFQVVLCAGDSKGDIGLAQATAECGGLVIVRGADGGLAAWAMDNLADNNWLLLEHYNGSALELVQQRIGGN